MNSNIKLAKKYGAKEVAYKNLPMTYQMAIAHYMAIDGEAWDELGITNSSRSLKNQLAKALPLYRRKYGRCKFGVVEIPTDILCHKIMSIPHLKDDHKTFEDYHVWYKENCYIPRHPHANRWPCIMDLTNKYNNVLEDGWHRFHSYVASGHKTIPCIYYLPKENYKYSYIEKEENMEKKSIDIDSLVEYYRGILEQDGWETLELTVRFDHPKLANKIMKALEK